MSTGRLFSASGAVSRMRPRGTRGPQCAWPPGHGRWRSSDPCRVPGRAQKVPCEGSREGRPGARPPIAGAPGQREQRESTLRCGLSQSFLGAEQIGDPEHPHQFRADAGIRIHLERIRQRDEEERRRQKKGLSGRHGERNALGVMIGPTYRCCPIPAAQTLLPRRLLSHKCRTECLLARNTPREAFSRSGTVELSAIQVHSKYRNV
jgi:hypothetical protein